jgi:uncharacterized protein YjbJ (UPF0337 family)
MNCGKSGNRMLTVRQLMEVSMGLDDKLSNKAEDLKGKAKEGAGKATGDDQLEGEGKGDQASASVKDGVEKVKDAGKDIKDAVQK